MKRVLKILLIIIIVIILTAITQIGGFVYLLVLSIKQRIKANGWILFFTIYLITTFIITPFFASFFGRERVSSHYNIKPTNYMYVLLNRNYATSKLNKVLEKSAHNLAQQKIEIRYLDASFPFIDGFPLLPHLSHNDGKKIDLSFVYQSKNGEITTKQKSVSGYGVFEFPRDNEINQISTCLNKGFWQYNLAKYITFGKINKDLLFSEKHTKRLINEFLKKSETQKIFIEPHLKQRLHLTNAKIRYHGCHAVRHDDHIHLQVH